MGEGLVTRLRARVAPPDSVHLILSLLPRPYTDEFAEDQLELAWEAHREEMMRHNLRSAVGFRPWAYWRFDLHEDRPDDDDAPIRLAELGLLREDELVRIVERANEGRARIGTNAEHRGPAGSADVDAVELHEAVKTALAREGRIRR
jgi:hypothetical protein